MSNVVASITMSLDGFVTGPNDVIESPSATHLRYRVSQPQSSVEGMNAISRESQTGS